MGFDYFFVLTYDSMFREEEERIKKKKNQLLNSNLETVYLFLEYDLFFT